MNRRDFLKGLGAAMAAMALPKSKIEAAATAVAALPKIELDAVGHTVSGEGWLYGSDFLYYTEDQGATWVEIEAGAWNDVVVVLF